MTSLSSLALASLSLLLLPACFEDTYEVAKSEVRVRYLPTEDALLILEIEHGIEEGGKTPDPVQKAADMLRAIAEGKRIFPASGEWIATDLDDLLANHSDLDVQEALDLKAFCDAIHVQESGLYLEDEGRLSLFRLTRFDHFQHLLELANASFNRKASRPSELALPFEPGFPIFDEENWKLYRSKVEKNQAWLTVNGSAIVLDLPMTSANAAHCLASIARDCPKDDNSEAVAQLVEQASGLEITEGHARLRFGDEPKSLLRFTYHSKKADSSEALIARLKQAGVALAGADAPRKALAKLEAGPAQIRSK